MNKADTRKIALVLRRYVNAENQREPCPKREHRMNLLRDLQKDLYDVCARSCSEFDGREFLSLTTEESP